MKDRRGWLAAALVAGLALRLFFALGFWVGRPLTLDEKEYLMLGRNLAAGKGLVYDDAAPEHFGRAPGYPAFLAAVTSTRDSPTAIRTAQAAVGTVGIALVVRLAGLAAGPQAALVAGFVAAAYPPLVWMPAYLLSETLYSVLALGAAVLLWQALRASDGAYRPRSFLLAGVVTGLAALVRPAELPYLALALGALALRRLFAPAAALALGAALAIAPWSLHRSLEAGRLVLIATEGGVTFWTGNHPLTDGEGDMAANPAIRADNERLRAAHPGLGPDELEPVYYRAANAFIREHPVEWLALLARKFFYLWVPIGPSYRLHSWLYLGATWISYLGLLPFAIAGWWRLASRGSEALPLWLLGGSVVLTCLVFSPQERFRIPVLDPVMIVGAAVALTGRRD